jgi:hypothetical protein
MVVPLAGFRVVARVLERSTGRILVGSAKTLAWRTETDLR